MHPSIVLSLCLAAGASAESPGPEIILTIVRDPYSSSDHVTLCRVRAINRGSRSWQGRKLVFEARALDGGGVIRERGRFGLELAPYGSLETLIALPGRHDRFAVEWTSSRASGHDRPKKPRKKTGGRKRSTRRR